MRSIARGPHEGATTLKSINFRAGAAILLPPVAQALGCLWMVMWYRCRHGSLWRVASL